MSQKIIYSITINKMSLFRLMRALYVIKKLILKPITIRTMSFIHRSDTIRVTLTSIDCEIHNFHCLYNFKLWF